jgi:hypothetical protein
LTNRRAVPFAAIKTTWYQAPGEAIGPVRVLDDPSKKYPDILPEPRKMACENWTRGSPAECTRTAWSTDTSSNFTHTEVVTLGNPGDPDIEI